MNFSKASNLSKRIAADGVMLALAAVFLFVGYCLVFFVTASFAATSNGLIKWGEGWQALKTLLCG